MYVYIIHKHFHFKLEKQEVISFGFFFFLRWRNIQWASFDFALLETDDKAMDIFPVLLDHMSCMLYYNFQFSLLQVFRFEFCEFSEFLICIKGILHCIFNGIISVIFQVVLQLSFLQKVYHCLISLNFWLIEMDSFSRNKC